MPTWTHTPNHPKQFKTLQVDEYTCGEYLVILRTPIKTQQYLSVYGIEGDARVLFWPATSSSITPEMLQQAIKMLIAIGADPKDLP